MGASAHDQCIFLLFWHNLFIMTDDQRKKEDLFDGVLLGIAQRHVGGIDDFLDTFFSFLVRKTDLFGSPEKARAIFSKHIEASCQKYVDKPLKKQEPQVIVPEQTRPSASCVETPDAEAVEQKHEKHRIAQDESLQKKSDCEEKLVPNSGNGADMKTYSYMQTISDIEIRFPLTQPYKSKDLVVKIERDRISVKLRNGQGALLDKQLTNCIRTDDAMWVLEDGAVCFQLTKQNQQEWWKAAFQGDREIDLSKVCPENSKLDDLDGETRRTVEKMMYDQRQKQMGLPTSDDEKKNEMLQKFMAAHPEMDFSNAKIA